MAYYESPRQSFSGRIVLDPDVQKIRDSKSRVLLNTAETVLNFRVGLTGFYGWKIFGILSLVFLVNGLLVGVAIPVDILVDENSDRHNDSFSIDLKQSSFNCESSEFSLNAKVIQNLFSAVLALLTCFYSNFSRKKCLVTLSSIAVFSKVVLIFFEADILDWLLISVLNSGELVTIVYIMELTVPDRQTNLIFSLTLVKCFGTLIPTSLNLMKVRLGWFDTVDVNNSVWISSFALIILSTYFCLLFLLPKSYKLLIQKSRKAEASNVAVEISKCVQDLDNSSEQEIRSSIELIIDSEKLDTLSVGGVSFIAVVAGIFGVLHENLDSRASFNSNWSIILVIITIILSETYDKRHFKFDEFTFIKILRTQMIIIGATVILNQSLIHFSCENYGGSNFKLFISAVLEANLRVDLE